MKKRCLYLSLATEEKVQIAKYSSTIFASFVPSLQRVAMKFRTTEIISNEFSSFSQKFASMKITHYMVSLIHGFEGYITLFFLVMNISFSQTFISVMEGIGVVELVLRKSPGGVGPVSVNLFTADGTATGLFYIPYSVATPYFFLVG